MTIVRPRTSAITVTMVEAIVISTWRASSAVPAKASGCSTEPCGIRTRARRLPATRARAAAVAGSTHRAPCRYSASAVARAPRRTGRISDLLPVAAVPARRVPRAGRPRAYVHRTA
ncbi:hypothetical protein GCM10020000_38080 [Streptomyces olivoverticillatus]